MQELCGQVGRTANGFRSCVLGALRTPWQEPVQGESSPAAPLLSSRLLIGWGVLREAESRASPPTRARGQEHQALLPPGAASSALSPTWSCSASRLRIGAPTTCSALLPRKLGGREEREELEEREVETGSLHTPSSPPLRAAGARGRRHCSSCCRYSLCLGCHLRRPAVRTRGAAPPTLLWSR